MTKLYLGGLALLLLAAAAGAGTPESKDSLDPGAAFGNLPLFGKISHSGFRIAVSPGSGTSCTAPEIAVQENGDRR